ncbi:MAG TPA: metal ABC transporter substrate-binding protein [Thermomicrobiales bacterium]|nr:metal ABC transporter substrate-binding protein [Thermomicrobiales bacterium]
MTSSPHNTPIRISRRTAIRLGVGVATVSGITAARQRPAAAQATPSASGLVVAASMPLLADIVANVAGDRATVFSIMPDSADPHTWEASPQDMVRVTEADTFISIGHHLEPFVEAGGWRRAVKEAGIPELAVTDHLELIEIDRVIDHGDHTHDLRAGDPHVWLDPLKVVEAIPVIRDHLVGLDPDGEAAYTAQAAAYARQVEALHEDLAGSFAAIPEDRRVLVIFHDAFTYFAARYDFDIVGVVMPNTEEGEVSAQEMADLIGAIEEHGITTVFAEPQFNTDVLSAIQDEAGVEIGELLTDSFAGRVGSYLDLMRFDRDSIVAALG